MRKLVGMMSLYLALTGLTACGTMQIGTGQKFEIMASNPEPEKYALLYFYRNDGWGYGGRANKPLLINVERGNDPKVPIVILNDQMYRPFLFEPQKAKLSGGSTEEVELKAGETRCFEQGWRFRGIDMIIFNEVQMEECKEALKNKELVQALNDIRRTNNAPPFAQVGFKELITAPSAIVPKQQAAIK